MVRADLHIHSRVSDGSMTLEELKEYGKIIGLTHMAVTDHDTTRHFDPSEEVFKDSGIYLLRGLEISGYDYKRNKKAHILGYFLKDREKAERFLSLLVNEREEAARFMVEKIKDAGYPITWEMVKKKASGSTNVYKQHIMDVLLNSGYTEKLKGELYSFLFKKGGAAYCEIRYPSCQDAVRLIKECGGIAVLAHPAGYSNMELIEELVREGLDGLEVYHPTHSEKDEAEVYEASRKYGLLMTGGSDFHGAYEGYKNPLGGRLTPLRDLERILSYT